VGTLVPGRSSDAAHRPCAAPGAPGAGGRRASRPFAAAPRPAPRARPACVHSLSTQGESAGPGEWSAGRRVGPARVDQGDPGRARSVRQSAGWASGAGLQPLDRGGQGRRRC
jgi:hypothetical protein